MSETAAEAIALHLREHQGSVVDWPYAALARELHRWVEIFDVEFKLNFPAYPVLRFARLRNAYANYAWFRTEIGTKDNITFNERELTRDMALTMRILLHELLHLWQHYHGKPSRTNYHNVEFRRKALDCGLIVDPRGCTSGNTEIFSRVLAKYGVRAVPLPAEPSLWGTGRDQKMKKWRCECTTIRCATALDARCLRCEQVFQRG